MKRLIWMMCLIFSAFSQTRQTDSLALVKIYNSTDGPNWINQANWLSSRPLNEWAGVRLENNRVSELMLYSKGLKGFIPSEIAQLTQLKAFSISNNPLLNGKLSRSINNLQHIENFGLENIGLSGPFLLDFSKTPNLSYLNLKNNQIDSMRPVNVEKLYISNNNFHFDEIEANTATVEYIYAPQRKVGKDSTLKVTSGDRITHTISVGGSNNEYQWLKNGVELTDQKTNTLTLPVVKEADSGEYILRITNTLRKALTLESYVQKVVVKPLDDKILKQRDSLALVALYNSTNGASWTNNTNWLTSAPLESWHGIKLSNNRVSEISLRFNNLVGPLPKDISQLSQLITMQFSANNLEGSIPSEIGQLINLQFLYLSSNKFTGSIPAELGNLIKLEGLNLERNELTGSIPVEFGNLVKVTQIDLSYNQLSGSIPKELGNLTNLKGLALENNQLSGNIPPELGQLSNLWTFVARGNKLTGQIPAELGNIPNLQGLRLSYNELSGSIPKEFSNWRNLSYLNLESNKLTGAIPTEFGNLVNLTQLTLQSNKLTDMPPLSRLTKLNRLTIENNYFEFDDLENIGLKPQTFTYGGMKSVLSDTSFYVDERTSFTHKIEVGGTNNRYRWVKVGVGTVSGQTTNTLTIPSVRTTDVGSYVLVTTNASFPGLTIYSNQVKLTIKTPRTTDSLALVKFYHSTNGNNWKNNTNWLSEKPIDEWYGVRLESGRVSHLSLYANNLVGPIPKEIAKLSQLNWLTLYGNKLSGSIPVELGELSNLETLALYLNMLTGEVPKELGKLKKLKYLSLLTNQLSGSIPKELGDLTKLSTLSLSRNRLNGTIPVEIGKLTNLTTLQLNNNELTGVIPEELGNLVKLGSLDLAHNMLTGSIPKELSKLAELYSLSLESNRLTGAVPAQLEALKKLIYVEIHQNKIDSLPKLSVSNSLVISNNQLEFDDIERNTSRRYAYSPQDSIGTEKQHRVNQDNTFSLQLEVGGANNVYQWLKDGVEIAGQTTNTLNIPSAKESDAGNYVLKITNTLMKDLTLYSHVQALSVVKDTIPPHSPSNVKAIAGDKKVILTWSKNTEPDFKSYILSDGVFKFTTTDTNYTFSNLTNGKEYTFSLLAKDSSGNSSRLVSISATPKDLTAPATPTGFIATPADAEVMLLWNKNTEADIKHYKLYYNVAGKDTTTLSTDTTYTVTNLVNGTEYRFSVSAVDLNGNESALSAPVVSTPDFTTILAQTSIYQNPLLTSHLMLSVISDRELNERPHVVLKKGSTETPITLRAQGSSKTDYRGALTLSGNGDYSLKTVVKASNGVTNESVKNFTAQTISAKTSNTFYADNGAKLTLQKNSVKHSGTMLYRFDREKETLLVEYGKRFDKEIKVELPLPESIESQHKAFVYKKVNDRWIPLPTQVYIRERKVAIYTKEPGEFKVMENLTFDGSNVVPEQFTLQQNYPNPFNPTTTIRYDLAENGFVSLIIFNALGQKVKTLVNEVQYAKAGHIAIWNATNRLGERVSSGVYFYQLVAGNKIYTKKMVLLK